MKKSKLGIIITYSAIFATVAVVGTNVTIGALSATPEETVYGHYLGVTPDKDHGGCNEY